jgi:low affinity Fe/Cu permease
MVFVIQNTQNRDTIAMQIKLDELIHVTRRASNTLLNLEELDDRELEALRQDYERLAQEIPRHLERRRVKSTEKSPPRKR